MAWRCREDARVAGIRNEGVGGSEPAWRLPAPAAALAATTLLGAAATAWWLLRDGTLPETVALVRQTAPAWPLLWAATLLSVGLRFVRWQLLLRSAGVCVACMHYR